MSNTETHAILPPRFVFEDDGLYVGSDNAHPHQDIKTVPIAIGVEWPKEGGLLLHLENRKYPKKGWVFREALWAIDSVKRAGINAVRFLTSKPLRYFLPLFLIIPDRWQEKIIRSAIDNFSMFSDTVFRNHGVYWKPQYWCAISREIWRVGSDMSSSGDMKFTKCICTVFEFDDVWRYIWQDIVGLINLPDFFSNPGKEAKRVLLIAAERSEGTRDKVEKMAFIIPFLFRVKYFRDSVFDFFTRVDMEKLYLDENDWYQCLTCSAYDFGGYTIESRNQLCYSIDKKWMDEGGKHFDTEGKEINILNHE